MKLDGIEFHGFKSFADSADIRFHDGITSIVGPNGCGKSNISDALRWVLGEQRPTAIRGARMEEAIFQGTAKRKPVQRAEVSLLLSNEDHLLPVPYSEVEISRTVYRGGDSEYRLNGTLCRLRDIQDLCRDTGLGTNAYAIIEGRMIDAILSDHAEERRQMFEEAAGIGRYKERTKVASRRLDEADADIARVDDLISEVETTVRSLARQRGRARRYHELRERKLALELALAHADLTRLKQRESDIEQELERIETERASQSARLRSTEAELESTRARLADLERARADGARRLMEVQERLAELEKQRLLAQERARHSRTRLERIATERGELSELKQELSAEVERLSQRRGEHSAVVESIQRKLSEKKLALASITERKNALETAAAAVESEQQSYRETRARLLARVEGSRAEGAELARRAEETERQVASLQASGEAAAAAASSSRSELEAARGNFERISEQLIIERARGEELKARYEELRVESAATTERINANRARTESLVPLASGEQGLNPAARAALEKADELGIRGVLGRSLEVSEALAEGVEAYLGSYMEGLIVDDGEAAERIGRWFEDDYDGPGGLVILPLDRIRAAGAPEADLAPGVRASGPGAAWVRHLLSGARLGDRSGEGSAWIGARSSVDPLGVYRFGQPHSGAGMLAHRAELDKLREQESELAKRSHTLRADVSGADESARRQAENIDQLEAARRSLEEDVGRLAARSEAANERLARSSEELEAARAAVARLRDEREKALGEGAAAESELRKLKPAGAEDAPDPEQLARVRAEWEEFREEVAELRLNEARAGAELENARRNLRAQRDSLATAQERAEPLAEEAEELASALSESEETAESAALDLERLFEERSSRESESRKMEERAEELRQTVTDLEAALKQVQHQEREHSEKRHELELENSEIHSELRRVAERLEDEWGKPFDELAAEVDVASGDHEDLRSELTDVAETLGGIGLVNMLAEQEYLEEKERLEFLREQRADLGSARDDLRSTIRQINDTASKALVETLSQIRENFNHTFDTLFEGGQCDVWLDNPDDPLDSPIEISASPRGKRTQRIHLLSGGERALTALALLFAIYLVKPSPFCVLDEVDAPLDETNIRRFVAMLEQFKSDVQFIVITHNPVTIEAADWIYGVTMEEPGVSKIVGVEFSEYARGAVA